MLPRRSVSTTEQQVGRDFSRDFANIGRPNRVTHTLAKSLEKTIPTFCSTVEKLRLGRINSELVCHCWKIPFRESLLYVTSVIRGARHAGRCVPSRGAGRRAWGRPANARADARHRRESDETHPRDDMRLVTHDHDGTH